MPLISLHGFMFTLHLFIQQIRIPPTLCIRNFLPSLSRWFLSLLTRSISWANTLIYFNEILTIRTPSLIIRVVQTKLLN